MAKVCIKTACELCNCYDVSEAIRASLSISHQLHLKVQRLKIDSMIYKANLTKANTAVGGGFV